jgi:hypothetical protein
MGSKTVLFADKAELTGGSPASSSGVSLGTQPFGTTSQLNTDANGNLSTPINVLFTATSFANGNYVATAVVTCQDGNP